MAVTAYMASGSVRLDEVARFKTPDRQLDAFQRDVQAFSAAVISSVIVNGSFFETVAVGPNEDARLTHLLGHEPKGFIFVLPNGPGAGDTHYVSKDSETLIIRNPLASVTGSVWVF